MGANWTELRKRLELPALGVALGLLIIGAYVLGVHHNETTGDAVAAESSGTSVKTDKADHRKDPGDRDDHDSKPEPVRVPASAHAASSSGMGGATWTSGDVAMLGTEFRRSVSNQFANSSLGQAQLGMAGLGFQCEIGAGGRMSCEKTLQAGNCTLTWSVSMQSRGGGGLGDAGGQGFSRDCGG